MPSKPLRSYFRPGPATDPSGLQAILYFDAVFRAIFFFIFLDKLSVTLIKVTLTFQYLIEASVALRDSIAKFFY
jgi:hypothetical protein